MATIQKFEDFRIWQEARELSQWFFSICQSTDLFKDFELRNQANRSAGSIMDNIAEGFERNGTREFIQFLAIVKGSAGEFKSRLYRMYDRNYITKAELEDKLLSTTKLGKGIGSFMKYLNQSKLKGSKFKSVSENKNP